MVLSVNDKSIEKDLSAQGGEMSKDGQKLISLKAIILKIDR